LQCLFWPTAATDFVVPREFWDTDLGKMLNQAKLRAYSRADLISVAEAKQLLGVTGSTVYRWMDDRTLGWVRDDANGRTWVVRRDVEVINRVASEIAAGRIPFERALAS
jgi:excisionase family DNA binding protein